MRSIDYPAEGGKRQTKWNGPPINRLYKYPRLPVRVSKIKWYSQQENVLTQEHQGSQDLREVGLQNLDVMSGRQDVQQTILVLLLEALWLVSEDESLHEELIRIISGILLSLKITGGHI